MIRLEERWEKYSPFFSMSEILSPDTVTSPHLVDIEALTLLNYCRKELGYPMFVNHQRFTLRGVVSAREAMSRGGAALTMHVTGKAFDVSCYQLSIQALADGLCEAGFSYVRKYPTWVHCDTRSVL